MTDSERSAFNSFKYVFPNIKQNGCHFHFAQSIWRHIQQIQSLSTKYKLDPNFALHIYKNDIGSCFCATKPCYTCV